MRSADPRALECTHLHRFLSPVPSTRIRAGVRAGLVAAAATAGAITGFGIRHHDWGGPFVSLGTRLMQGFGVLSPSGFVPSAAGVVVHVGWMVLWGILFAALAHRKGRGATVLVAVLIGVAAALTARSFMPGALGAVSFAPLSGIQWALCVVLMTAGLGTGRALSSVE